MVKSSGAHGWPRTHRCKTCSELRNLSRKSWRAIEAIAHHWVTIDMPRADSQFWVGNGNQCCKSFGSVDTCVWILKQLFDAANRSHIASHRITSHHINRLLGGHTRHYLQHLAAVQPMIPPKTWPIMLLTYCRDAAGCTTQSTHAPKSSKSSKHIIKTCVKIFVYVCCIENI